MQLLSISARISPILRRPGLEATVESAFAQACNLVTPHGEALALVSRAVGNGPLNAVLSQPQALAALQPGSTVYGDGVWLHLAAGWRLALAPAKDWNPTPHYSRLARRPRLVAHNLAELRRRLPLYAPDASLAATPSALNNRPMRLFGEASLAQTQAHAAIDGLLHSYQAGDLARLGSFAARLAGLGPGLTPAGDDWLAGWLVGLHATANIRDGEPPLALKAVARTVIDRATTRTTRLSLAFLQAAAEGAAAEAWHRLIAALPDADPAPTHAAMIEIMRYGATSGADMLAGFLAAFAEGNLEELEELEELRGA
jgi:hypothetical protein